MLLLLGVAVVEAYFLVCWRLLGPVTIIERNFAVSALHRSRALIIGSWWRTLALLLTMIFIDFVSYHFLRFAWGFVPLIGVIFGHAMLAVFGTYATVVFVIYYFDRRCRTEAFDPGLVAAQPDAHAEAARATRSVLDHRSASA